MMMELKNTLIAALIDVKTATVIPGTVTAGQIAAPAVAAAGVKTTDHVIAIPPTDLQTGLVPVGVYVSATDSITVRLYNPTTAAITDTAGKVWKFLVVRPAITPYYTTPT
jgi:hypothetical protein